MSPSPWVHAMCDGCWKKRHPDRDPARANLFDEGEPDACCYCDAPINGIYVREDPQLAPCRGNHGVHEDEEAS